MTTLTQAIKAIKAQFGVPKLVIEADPANVEEQTTMFFCKVGFIQALQQAIQSFIEDGRNPDSPVGTIIADPGAFDLPEVKSKTPVSELVRSWMGDRDAFLPYDGKTAPAASELVRSWMNEPTSKIILCTPEYRYLPENGERVEENWIFRLYVKPSRSIHWAIVGREGVKEVYNYGYG